MLRNRTTLASIATALLFGVTAVLGFASSASAAGGTKPFKATFGVCPKPAWSDHHQKATFVTDTGVQIIATGSQIKKYNLHAGESIVATVTPPGSHYLLPDTLDSITSTTWRLSAAQTNACNDRAAGKPLG